jgi:hypothetical protein
MVATNGRIEDLPVERRRWFSPVDAGVALPAGARTPDPLRIPQADATRLLRGFVRFVADIPAGTSLDVVWEQPGSELWVDAGSIDVACSSGLLKVGLSVACDEIRRPSRVALPFAVGRADASRGLLMSTINRIDAPALIADRWSDAIVAFCWEALLELARRVSAQAGSDDAGLPLIPSGIASEDGVLIVQPMARHDLSGLTTR